MEEKNWEAIKHVSHLAAIIKAGSSVLDTSSCITLAIAIVNEAEERVSVKK